MFGGVRSMRLVGLRLFAASLVTGAVAVAVLPAQVAEAGTDVVTTCSGSASTAGSLPYEVTNAISGDTITFSVSCPPASPITLASTIDLTENLTIDGPGPSAVAVTGGSGGGSDGGSFDVESGVTAATISGLTVENGDAGTGGGIYNDGILTVSDSTLSDNVAGGLEGQGGGGIYNDGILTVSDSTLSGNQGGTHGRPGGGILNDGMLDVIDSTLVANVATAGAGISNEVGATANVTGSTLSGNAAPPGDGGGILNDGTASLAATIVAESPSSSGGDCAGTIIDAGYNLDDDGSCGFSPVNHSQSDVDPDLGPLQDNGGPTETEAPANVPGSPVLNQIPTGAVANSLTLCPGLDQTETYRPQGPECDVGAFEVPLPRVSAVSPTTGLNTGGTPVTISGSGFTGATFVYFGTYSAAVTVVNNQTITTSSPPQSAGPEDVTVTTPVGTSDTNPADVFIYGVNQPPATANCDPNCTVTATSPDPTTTVASGSSGTDSNASINLQAPSQDTLMSCGGRYDYDAPVWTMSTSGFVSTTPVTVSETVQGEPSVTGVKVCYEALTSSTPKFLRHCAATPVAPCLQSLAESMDSVTALFYAPPNDPRFWTGNATVTLGSFSPSRGAPGSKVTIKGKNLKAVNAVVIAGLSAQIDTETNAKLKVTIPQTDVAETGFITVVADSNRAVSSGPFTITP
jgi:hypothetical protein